MEAEAHSALWLRNTATACQCDQGAKPLRTFVCIPRLQELKPCTRFYSEGFLHTSEWGARPGCKGCIDFG